MRVIKGHSSSTSRLFEFLVCKSAVQLSTNHLVLRISRKKGTRVVGEFFQSFE